MTALREPIERSWSRCTAAGLDPGDPADRFVVHETDPSGDLVRAAGPVLDALADDLAGTSVAAILTDADARVTAIRYGRADLRGRMERAGAVPGRWFAERETGTNAIATVHATGRGLAVDAGEHYLERWRCYTCYGHPVQHPVTGGLLGVLDLTGVDGGGSSLLAPLVRRAVRDIRDELLAGAGTAHRRLLAAYQEAVRGGSAPVLVLGHDVVLADPRCSELLGPGDHEALRALLDDGAPAADLVVDLAHGPTRVRWRAVPDTAGAVVALRPLLGGPRPDGPEGGGRARGTGSSAGPAPGWGSSSGRAVPGAILVAGEPGSGRTTAVGELVADTRHTVLEAADLTPTSEHSWMGRAARSLAAPGETTVVEDLHLLLASTATRLRRLMASPHARLVLTSCPVEELAGDGAALAAACTQRIDLSPLRTRAHEIPALATAVLGAVRADETVRFTDDALAVLSAHRWPGNLRELVAVVTDAAARRSAGDIGPTDLPARCRRAASVATDTAGDLARAEREAIEASLAACGGNKVQAARRLGISRSTLYTRLRALHLTV